MQMERGRRCGRCGCGGRNEGQRQSMCPILCCGRESGTKPRRADGGNETESETTESTMPMSYMTYEVKSALPVAAFDASLDNLVLQTAPLWPDKESNVNDTCLPPSTREEAHQQRSRSSRQSSRAASGCRLYSSRPARICHPLLVSTRN